MAELHEESLYARPEFSGYSLWAAPDAAAAAELARAIEAFAARLDTPLFPPHMTVLAGIKASHLQMLELYTPQTDTSDALDIRQDLARDEAVAKTEQLAALLRSLDAEIEVVTSKVRLNSPNSAHECTVC